MNVEDRINALDRKLEDLISRLSRIDSELNFKIDDAKNDGERATESLREDLRSLEHKVDYQ